MPAQTDRADDETLAIAYSRPRVALLAIFYVGTAVFLLAGMRHGINWSLPDWLIAIIAAVVFVLGLRLAWLVFAPGGPIMVVRSDGIRFERPALGFVPWEEVLDIDIGTSLFRKNVMTVRLRPPKRVFPVNAWLYYPMLRLIFRDPNVYELGLYLTDRSGLEVYFALERLWPGLGREKR